MKNQKSVAAILLLCTPKIWGCFHDIPTSKLPSDGNNNSSLIQWNAFENNVSYILQMSIPRVERKDLNVSVDYEKRQLEVAGASTLSRASDDANIRFQRSWHIDPSVNLLDMTMSYQNGLVTVSIPKRTIQSYKKKAPMFRDARHQAVASYTAPITSTRGSPSIEARAPDVVMKID